MAHKIAIINSSSFGTRFPDQIERLKRLGDIERFTFPIETTGKELAEKLKGFDILIASVTPFFTREFFDYKDETMLISRHGIGYNNIDIAAATEKGTIITIVSPQVERDAVAENAVTGLLALIRKTASAAQAAKSGQWSTRAQFIGSQLTGKTAGIIGFGNIGSRVGDILKNGFHTRLLAYDPYLSRGEFEKWGAEPVTLDELLQQADMISLHALLTKETYHMISDREISLMKKGVYIANTARGELLDQDAVLKGIEQGVIAGLAADVIEGEPINEHHPFFKYENILVTPHTSAYTDECLRGMGEKVVSDVERTVSGVRPENVVNKEVLSH